MTAVGDSRNGDDTEPLQVWRFSPFKIAAYVTLLADAYLVLASLASRVMNNASASYLLPFRGGKHSDESHVMVLIIATWTAVLAVGCLSSRRTSSKDNYAAVVVWVVLVLAVPWFFVLMPIALSALRWAKHLYLYGP